MVPSTMHPCSPVAFNAVSHFVRIAVVWVSSDSELVASSRRLPRDSLELLPDGLSGRSAQQSVAWKAVGNITYS